MAEPHALPATWPDLLSAAVADAIAPLLALIEEIARDMGRDMRVAVMQLEFQMAGLKRDLRRLRGNLHRIRRR